MGWKIQNAHKWIEKPHTAYERRRELRVRESRHTVMLFDTKYLDIDTGKYKTDKLPSLGSQSLGDIIDDSVHNRMRYGYIPQSQYQGYYEVEPHEEDIFGEPEDEVITRVRQLPKFVPKDDDFEPKSVKVEAKVIPKPIPRLPTPEEFQAAKEAQERREREYYERERQRNTAYEQSLNAAKIETHRRQQQEMLEYYAKVQSEREQARRAEEKRVKEEEQRQLLEFHKRYAEAAIKIQENSRKVISRDAFSGVKKMKIT